MALTTWLDEDTPAHWRQSTPLFALGFSNWPIHLFPASRIMKSELEVWQVHERLKDHMEAILFKVQPECLDCFFVHFVADE